MTIPGFRWTVRVYYEDTDAGGIVFYANYLKFFERARTEWLRAKGIEQRVMAEEAGVVFVVGGASVEYHAPARLDDELIVSVDVERVGRASVRFLQQAWRASEGGHQLLATAAVKVGCIDGKRFRPASIPAKVLEKIRGNAA